MTLSGTHRLVMSVAPPLAPPPVLRAPRRPLLAALVVLHVPGAAVEVVEVMGVVGPPPGLELVVALVRRPLWLTFVLQVVVRVGAAVGGERRPLGTDLGVPVSDPAPSSTSAALGRSHARPLVPRPLLLRPPVPGAPTGTQAIAAPVRGSARRPLGAVGGAARGEGGAVGAERAADGAP